MPIRIVLADDHQIVLHGLQQLFDRQEDCEVVGCCRDAAAAIEAVETLTPDVLVLDLRMPQRGGLDVLQALAGRHEQCRRVLLTAAIRDEEVMEAMKLGATGLVLKESAPEALLECVRAVYAGKQWIERDTLARAFRAAVDREAALKSGDALTPRETEIVKMVSQGLRNKVIAERLSISEGTVKVHLHNTYEKLGVDGRLELVLIAQQRGLL
ncbi:MAG: response regulator transcription factor [Acidobacteriota bacterium]